MDARLDGGDGLPPDVPEAIDSPYSLGSVNPEVLLRTTGLVLAGEGREIALSSGRVFVSSKPRFGLRFEGHGPASNKVIYDLALGGWQPTDIRLEGSGLSGRVQIGANVGGDATTVPGTVSIAGGIAELVEGGGGLDHVLFHVPNFYGFLGRWSKRGSSRSSHRLELRAAGWSVVIDAREGLQDILDDLRAEGGYAFTHVGVLRREDGDIFSPDDAEHVLDGLYWFLSFVRGIWVAPIIFEGSSVDGAVSWRKWAIGRSGSWRGPPTWCDFTGWKAAQEAFVGFMAEWNQPFTNSVMRIAIGQYVSANSPDPAEVSIMVTQSGLELLGWTTFVETGVVKKKAWKNMRASENISMLLEKAHVDLSIPAAVSTLAGLHPDWKSGPAAVAGVRNQLVHPSKRGDRVGWDEQVLVDAWRLSSRYLELALLHRMGVTSPIRNRLNPNVWTGATEPPPWADTEREGTHGVTHADADREAEPEDATPRTPPA